MPEATDLFVFFAWILGGFVSGVSGIGGAMVAFPLLALVIPVHQLIALTCIINVVMDGCLAGMHFRHCRLSSLWPMLAGSVPGSFAGLYILQICSGAVLQGAVGLLLLYYVYWQMTYRAAQGPVSHPRMLGAAAGFGAGLLGTAISFDGPPIGAYGLCMGWEPRVFLGTLGVFFVIRGSLTVILQATAGFSIPRKSWAMPCTGRPVSSWARCWPSPWPSASRRRPSARSCWSSSAWPGRSAWCAPSCRPLFRACMRNGRRTCVRRPFSSFAGIPESRLSLRFRCAGPSCGSAGPPGSAP